MQLMRATERFDGPWPPVNTWGIGAHDARTMRRALEGVARFNGVTP
jgi:hypothetical protein